MKPSASETYVNLLLSLLEFCVPGKPSTLFPNSVHKTMRPSPTCAASRRKRMRELGFDTHHVGSDCPGILCLRLCTPDCPRLAAQTAAPLQHGMLIGLQWFAPVDAQSTFADKVCPHKDFVCSVWFCFVCSVPAVAMVKRRPAADRLASKRRADRCSGLIKQATAVPISLPHRLRNHGPGSTVEETDCTGDRIVMLAQRSDVQAVRHISKKLYKTLGRTPEFMKWCLLAQRLYDPISLERVFVPFVLENQAFTKKKPHAFAQALRSCLRRFLLLGVQPYWIGGGLFRANDSWPLAGFVFFCTSIRAFACCAPCAGLAWKDTERDHEEEHDMHATTKREHKHTKVSGTKPSRSNWTRSSFLRTSWCSAEVTRLQAARSLGISSCWLQRWLGNLAISLGWLTSGP